MNPRNLDRQIKRDIYGKAQSVRVTSAPGWLDVLESEVREVLASWALPSKFVPSLEPYDQGVSLKNLDFRNLIELPLRLQTAADIRWSLLSRHVGSFAEFHECLAKVPWDLVLPANSNLEVKVESYRSKLFHEGKLSDIIHEHLSAKGYQLNTAESGFRLYFEQVENRHEVFLSMSREPLYHRSYKAALAHRAPLQEHLGAAAIQWFFSLEQQKAWTPTQIYVPFAGSGTLWAETMIKMLQIPLHNWREKFGCEAWPCFPQASWQLIERRRGTLCLKGMKSLPSILLEREPEICQRLPVHVERFRAGGTIPFPTVEVEIKEGDFFDYSLSNKLAHVFLPLNPPYGIRLEQGDTQKSAKDAAAFYLRLAQRIQVLRESLSSVRGFVLVPDPDSLRAFTETLGATRIQGVHSFSQGGQHIRCVAFE